MATISREQLAGILYEAGFRGEQIADMVAIAGRESSYTPDAHRTDQPKSKLSGDLGLFQINYVNWPLVSRELGLTDKSQLFDPLINARAAKVLYDASGYQPWTAGPGGWTAGGDPFYGTNRTAARAAVSRWEANPTQYSYGGIKPATVTETATRGGPIKLEDAKLGKEVKRTNTIEDYAPPERDPAQQAALTTLLQGFGVEYPNAPRATPSLLTFLRGLGMNYDEADARFDEMRAEVQRRSADRAGDLALSDSRRRRSLGIDAQRRGALVSGATNSAFARQAEDYGRAQADLERGTADSIAALGRDRDTVQSGLRTAAMERAIGVEEQQATYDATKQAEVEALRYAQEESDLAYQRTREAERERAQRQIDLYNQAGVR